MATIENRRKNMIKKIDYEVRKRLYRLVISFAPDLWFCDYNLKGIKGSRIDPCIG